MQETKPTTDGVPADGREDGTLSVPASGGVPPAEESASVETPSPEELTRLARIVESVLFAAGAPVCLKKLVEILEGPSATTLTLAVELLKDEYGAGMRGIQLHEIAGGYQFRTARENAQWVRALFREKPARLGRAALETLAVVAYKQPVTKAEIEAIRGVDVDGTLSTLLARRLIKIAGRKEAVGRPLLYATSAEFLEAFQLKNLRDLPSLKELGSTPENTPYESDALIDTSPVAEITEDRPDDASTEAARDEEEDTVPGIVRAGDGTAAENPEPRGDRIETAGGGTDPDGTGEGERQGGDRAGDEGESSH